MNEIPAIVGVNLLMLTFAGLIGWVIWLLVKRQERQASIYASMRTEQLRAILDRFGSADEFVQFVQSPRGEQLLNVLSAGGAPASERLHASLRSGVVTLVPAVGFGLLAWLYDADFIVVAVGLAALGVGFLASAAVTHLLSREEQPRHEK